MGLGICAPSPLPPCREQPPTASVSCTVLACALPQPCPLLLMGEFSRAPGKKLRERADADFDVNLRHIFKGRPGEIPTLLPCSAARPPY